MVKKSQTCCCCSASATLTACVGLSPTGMTLSPPVRQETAEQYICILLPGCWTTCVSYWMLSRKHTLNNNGHAMNAGLRGCGWIMQQVLIKLPLGSLTSPHIDTVFVFFSLSLSVSNGNSSIATENLINQMFFFKSPLKRALKMKKEVYQHYFSHFGFFWCSEIWTSSRAKTKETYITVMFWNGNIGFEQQLNRDRFLFCILHTVSHCTNLFPCQTIEELLNLHSSNLICCHCEGRIDCLPAASYKIQLVRLKIHFAMYRTCGMITHFYVCEFSLPSCL